MDMDDEYRAVLKADRAYGLEFSGDVVIVPSLEPCTTGNAVWYGTDGGSRHQDSSVALKKQSELAESHRAFKLLKVACYGEEGDRWADVVAMLRERPWAANVVDQQRGGAGRLALH